MMRNLWVISGAVGSALLAILVGVAVSSCKSERASAPPSKKSTAVVRASDKGAKKSIFPPAARRDSPPPGIDGRLIALGKLASPIALATSGGDRWSLEEAVKNGPVVLVFYRGHW